MNKRQREIALDGFIEKWIVTDPTNPNLGGCKQEPNLTNLASVVRNMETWGRSPAWKAAWNAAYSDVGTAINVWMDNFTLDTEDDIPAFDQVSRGMQDELERLVVWAVWEVRVKLAGR